MHNEAQSNRPYSYSRYLSESSSHWRVIEGHLQLKRLLHKPQLQSSSTELNTDK